MVLRKLLLFFLVFLNLSYAQEPVREPAERPKGIHRFSAEVSLPTGALVHGEFLVDEIGQKVKAKFFDDQGNLLRSLDSRREGSFVFNEKGFSANLLDMSGLYALFVLKRNGDYHFISVPYNSETQGLNIEAKREISATREETLSLPKFSARGYEIYFNPCENQLVVLKEGVNLVRESSEIQQFKFMGATEQEGALRQFTYELKYGEETDHNGEYRFNFSWNSRTPNEIILTVPPAQSLRMMIPREEADKMVQCLREQHGKDFVTNYTLESTETHSCSSSASSAEQELEQKAQEILQKSGAHLSRRQGILDPEDL